MLFKDLYLMGEISLESVLPVIQSIHEINREDYNTPVDAREPINLYINSVGGDVIAAFTLISVMESSVTPINTHAVGEVLSAALLIFIVGSRRIAYKHSTFMYHSVSAVHAGDSKHIDVQYAYTKNIQERIEEITSLYTNMTLKKLKDLSDKREDYYFYYIEALEHKVADEIEIDAIYERDVKLIEEKFPNSTLDLENITEIIQNIPEEELLELISKYK